MKTPEVAFDFLRNDDQYLGMRKQIGPTAERLRASMGDLRDRFGVCGLSVFGSRTRGDQLAGSDLDVLVEFDRPIGMLAFNQLESELSDLTGFQVDLVMRSALRPHLKARIVSEAIPIL